MKNSISPQARMRSYLQLVATGPELSKSLNLDQAEDAMSMILNGDIDAVRSGIFLIALRMKRESDAENIGILNALLKNMHQAQTHAEDIIAVADPFNGYLRGLPATPFLPAVIAACGVPAYSHGLLEAGPKYGITSRMVLAAAGRNVDRTVAEAAECLDNPKIGWAYVDQKHYCPKLHDLVNLRDVMVKRCCLSTLEVVLNPLKGARNSHLLTGFVHKAYPPVYGTLARHAGFTSAIIVRGVEGGCIPSLSQLSRYFGYHNDAEVALQRLEPKVLGIEQDKRMVVPPEECLALLENSCYENTQVLEPVVAHTLELGLDALGNKPGTMRDSLIYGAAIVLTHIGLVNDLAEGAEKARSAIANGNALARFAAG